MESPHSRRSRSPLQQSSSNLNKSSDRYSPSSTERQPHKGYADTVGCKVLIIKNLPKNWNFHAVKNFILANTKSEIVKKNLGFVTLCPDKPGQYLVRFYHPEACQVAKLALMGMEVEGRKIFVYFDIKNIEKKYSAKNPNAEQYASAGFRQPLQDPNITPFHDTTPIPPSHNFETYGLSKNFLNSLDIKPPLNNKIFIGNLDRNVDEKRLRAVFSLAGKILHVELLKQDLPKLMATVEFDHPVEAVQAISMFNNQKLYSRCLNVQMFNKPNTFLPDGLQSFGPGLGPNGIPLKGVRYIVELESIKKLIAEQVESLKNVNHDLVHANQGVQDNNMEINNSLQPSPIMPQMPMNVTQNPMALFNPNHMNQNNAPLGLGSVLNPLQMLQGFLQTAGNDGLGMLNALQTQFVTQSFGQNVPGFGQNESGFGQNASGFGQNASGFGQNALRNRSEWGPQIQQPNNNVRLNVQSDPGPPAIEPNYSNYEKQQPHYDNRRQYIEHKNPENDKFTEKPLLKYQEVHGGENSRKPSDMLVFNNLPPTVSLQSLSTKMREVGDVKFAEMTGQGRAIVRFYNVRDAERCIELFHRSKVDGEIIEVRFF